MKVWRHADCRYAEPLKRHFRGEQRIFLVRVDAELAAVQYAPSLGPKDHEAALLKGPLAQNFGHIHVTTAGRGMAWYRGTGTSPGAVLIAGICSWDNATGTLAEAATSGLVLPAARLDRLQTSRVLARWRAGHKAARGYGSVRGEGY